MYYYNRNSEKLNLDIGGLSYLKRGGCGEIFHNDSIIFKRYFSHTGDYYRIRPQIFDVLKSLNNPHIIEIFDIYRSTNIFFTEPKAKNWRQSFRTDAYTAKYYQDDNVNPLLENIDYILDNFREIEKLFDMFADNAIFVDDVKRTNAILSSNAIILIDPDTFHVSEKQKEFILANNKDELLYLFYDICIYEFEVLLSKEQQKHNFAWEKVDELYTEITVDENTDVTYEISKKLQHVKRPIDYFIK